VQKYVYGNDLIPQFWDYRAANTIFICNQHVDVGAISEFSVIFDPNRYARDWSLSDMPQFYFTLAPLPFHDFPVDTISIKLFHG
jgi:hypothetical protein